MLLRANRPTRERGKLVGKGSSQLLAMFDERASIASSTASAASNTLPIFSPSAVVQQASLAVARQSARRARVEWIWLVLLAERFASPSHKHH